MPIELVVLMIGVVLAVIVSFWVLILSLNLLVSSSIKKVVSHSSAKFECKGLANATIELTWIQSLLCELHVPLLCTLIILCDNLSMTYLAVNPMMHSSPKHVEIDYHFVHKHIL